MAVTGTPAGGLTRPYLVCDADRVRCPRNHVIPRIAIQEGSCWARCEHTIHGHACGTLIFIAGTQGIAIVVPVSAEEFERLSGTGMRAGAVLRDLGILPGREVAAA